MMEQTQGRRERREERGEEWWSVWGESEKEGVDGRVLKSAAGKMVVRVCH